jgi:hypothetical protein
MSRMGSFDSATMSRALRAATSGQTRALMCPGLWACFGRARKALVELVAEFIAAWIRHAATEWLCSRGQSRAALW